MENTAHSTGRGRFLSKCYEGPFHYIFKKHFNPRKMIFSNEPGIYKNGKYGIRIENLVFTKSISINKKKFLV